MSETVERMLPLYEAKMVHLFDHQWATFESGSIRDLSEDEKDAGVQAIPRYWVRETVVQERRGRDEQAVGWRRIARATDERTMIACAAEDVGYGDSVFLMRAGRNALGSLQAVLSSFVVDFAFRQKIGGTNTSFFLVAQAPVLGPAPLTGPCMAGDAFAWLSVRADALQRRTVASDQRDRVRAEIDAAMFHLYGIEREDVDYIMETFPIVKRKDIAAHGEYRTKRMILEIYDEMAEAIASGTTYVSPFDEELAGD